MSVYKWEPLCVLYLIFLCIRVSVYILILCEWEHLCLVVAWLSVYESRCVCESRLPSTLARRLPARLHVYGGHSARAGTGRVHCGQRPWHSRLVAQQLHDDPVRHGPHAGRTALAQPQHGAELPCKVAAARASDASGQSVSTRTSEDLQESLRVHWHLWKQGMSVDSLMQDFTIIWMPYFYKLKVGLLPSLIILNWFPPFCSTLYSLHKSWILRLASRPWGTCEYIKKMKRWVFASATGLCSTSYCSPHLRTLSACWEPESPGFSRHPLRAWSPNFDQMKEDT